MEKVLYYKLPIDETISISTFSLLSGRLASASDCGRLHIHIPSSSLVSVQAYRS